VTANTLPANLLDRIQQLARKWRVTIGQSFETETSVISFVSRNNQSLVLKVIRQEGDEWHAGQILKAFDGHGVVRIYEYAGGAMLLERLRPGNNLVDLALNDGDEEATEILADVIQRMTAIEPALSGVSTQAVEDWGKGFGRYLATDDPRVPRHLVESAQRVFANLCASQSQKRLLHGDLHHYNVLFDSQRGWLAIDPKGVLGELEYEIGAILRNPIEAPDLFLSSSMFERRIDRLTRKLNLNPERVVAWAFGQAVLSAIWEIEDGFEVPGTNSPLKLADVIWPML